MKPYEVGLLNALAHNPSITMEAMRKAGATPQMMSEVARTVFDIVTSIHERGGVVTESAILTEAIKRAVPGVADVAKKLVEGDESGNVQEYATRIAEDHWVSVLASLKPRGGDALAIAQHYLHSVQEAVNGISRARRGGEKSLADLLEEGRGWYIKTGIDALDAIGFVAPTGITMIAGDPGVGKTTMAMSIARYNALQGHHVTILTAETNEVEYILGILTQLQAIQGWEATRLLYGQDVKHDEILEVDAMWQEVFPTDKLSVQYIPTGADAILTAASAVPDNSILIVDHLYHIVQGTERRNEKDFVIANRFLNRLDSIVRSKKLVAIVLNQFTKSGRERVGERGLDAEYGGSGIANIASAALHLERKANIGNSFEIAGYIVKVRVMPFVTESGRTLDPRGFNPVTMYYTPKHRMISNSIPIAGGKR